jgi:hypothetical protein
LSTTCSSARWDAPRRRPNARCRSTLWEHEPNQAAIEDLLWSVVMLPEFQVVR